jgi:nitrate reductase delta subunit
MLLQHLADLLEYPVVPPADACAAARGEAGATPGASEQIDIFADATRALPLPDLQELYARTFDFEADTALYVGHHLFGEEGRRGQLIAGLVDRYARLQMDLGVELADHFVPVLRSLALDGESDEARELVRFALRPALARVLPNVERRAAPFAAVLRAVALVIDGQSGEPFETRSDPCRSSSSPYFLTLLS